MYGQGRTNFGFFILRHIPQTVSLEPRDTHFCFLQAPSTYIPGIQGSSKFPKAPRGSSKRVRKILVTLLVSFKNQWFYWIINVIQCEIYGKYARKAMASART